MQFLGLLCMYFDAVVVEVKKNLLQIGFGHTVGDGVGAAIVTYGGGSGDGVVAGKLS